MSQSTSSVLYVSEDSAWGRHGRDAVAGFFPGAHCVSWKHGEPFPQEVAEWEGKWILSFKSDLILPKSVIQSASEGAINFHPAPPEYRGLGGYMLAVHNRDEQYGVTCHYMIEEIDYGPIIHVHRFLMARDTPHSLRQRAAAYSLVMLNEIAAMIYKGERPEPCNERWSEKIYTLRKVERICGPASPGTAAADPEGRPRASA